ncbi:3-phosphoshikimate 1-carboxyvinyltransferase, partial [Lactobacillus sp. XV13L]|nr:3-phosphoshikimate 1-carboxyvinyltransferase [Lactobacillus sp. XV13L]
HGRGIQGLQSPHQNLNMGNSGTTTRLLTGLLSGQHLTATLIGDSSLSQRPMQRVQQPLQKMGAQIQLTSGHLPLIIVGQPLKSLSYQMPIASAQVKSALILAALQADTTSTIIEHLPTRDHTERLLRQFGGVITTSPNHYTITVNPQPKLLGQDLTIPGDISSAAFFITAATIIPHSRIKLIDVGLNSTRTGILKVLKKMGGKVHISTRSQNNAENYGTLEIQSASLKPIKLTAADIPSVIDELPLIALLAATAEGTSEISGAAELRVKETDRIATIVCELRKFGIKIIEKTDGFIIYGQPNWTINNPHLDSHGDHRIGMMLAIAALKANQPLTLKNSGAVNISYPNFFQDLHSLIIEE